MAKKDEKKAAQAFGQRAASKGGKARANVLSPEERRRIAKQAARARWGKDDEDGSELEEVHDLLAPLTAAAVTATSDKPYSMFRGTLAIGDVELQCHVLNDGRRVLTQREVVRALSGGRVSGSYLQNIPGYDVASLPSRVIHFTDPGGSRINHGFEAALLIEICEAYLQARDRKDGSLKPNQENIARAADLIVRACARVGIEALIDEATGYQEVRGRMRSRSSSSSSSQSKWATGLSDSRTSFGCSSRAWRASSIPARSAPGGGANT